MAAAAAFGTPPPHPSARLLRRVEALWLNLEEVSERRPPEPVSAAWLRREIETIMAEKVGFGRDERGLLTAAERMSELEADYLPRVCRSRGSRAYNYDLVEVFELENMLEVGLAVAAAALRRTETRGCHNRMDHPFLCDEHWRVHLLVTKRGPDYGVEKIPVVARERRGKAS
ncbi:MAG: hypothetical protein M5U22_16490 [Thermoleophilia bacterium]|nr:hypothetical protein [Thermoleophilia bacterium]